MRAARFRHHLAGAAPPLADTGKENTTGYTPL
jgi:hypothetical protein